MYACSELFICDCPKGILIKEPERVSHPLHLKFHFPQLRAVEESIMCSEWFPAAEEKQTLSV